MTSFSLEARLLGICFSLWCRHTFSCQEIESRSVKSLENLRVRTSLQTSAAPSHHDKMFALLLLSWQLVTIALGRTMKLCRSDRALDQCDPFVFATLSAVFSSAYFLTFHQPLYSEACESQRMLKQR
jgi:hypothetical protein